MSPCLYTRRDGRLRTNDQMLNVNGISLLNLSNTDAMEILKRAIYTEGPKPGTISLTIARKVGGSASANQNCQRSSSPKLPVDCYGNYTCSYRIN